jgi:hypothetical protein
MPRYFSCFDATVMFSIAISALTLPPLCSFITLLAHYAISMMPITPRAAAIAFRHYRRLSMPPRRQRGYFR